VGHHIPAVKSPIEALATPDGKSSADLVVLDMEDTDNCKIIADIASRPKFQNAEILIVAPKGRSDIAALALDLGASDVAFDDSCAKEIGLRANNLLKRKRKNDSRRERVRSGLQAAVTDPLTGLYNRRYAESHLHRMSEKAAATGQSFALMMFDIDHFKQINDRFGHAAGDQILVKLADRLRANFRSIDLIARVGGEEFMIGMPDTSIAQARIAAERMRRTVSRKTFVLADGMPAIRITISGGVAVDQVLGQKTLPTSQLFNHADAALYEAKNSGRDMVKISSMAA